MLGLIFERSVKYLFIISNSSGEGRFFFRQSSYSTNLDSKSLLNSETFSSTCSSKEGEEAQPVSVSEAIKTSKAMGINFNFLCCLIVQVLSTRPKPSQIEFYFHSI